MLRIYNTLTRKVEEFNPLNPPSPRSAGHVGMYTCGPTVYDYAHIGNFRTYTTSDILVRVLKYNGFDVKYVMNLTDVGHLTGDNLGDADLGEDRVEQSAKREGKSAWDIAKFYTEAFLKDYERLNLTKPMLFSKATDHIKEQIELILKLEKKGYTYKTSDGIYFDTFKFKDYGKLSHLDQIKEGARVEPNPEKRNPRDFALWKFSYPKGRSFDSSSTSLTAGAQAFGSEVFDREAQTESAQARRDDSASRRHMEWESPWGVGFPGWHIECSAMALKYLTESFDPFGKLRVNGERSRTIDIHAGGVDLSSTHHPNEIAQSEAATGKPFVSYWVHGAFMLVDGKRMSKSLGNNYRLDQIVDKGFDPLSLRYLYLQTHYRQEMNFTLEALKATQHALNRLREEVSLYDGQKIGCAEYEQNFLEAINDDLNIPKALSILWDVVKSDYPGHAKAQSIFKFDEVLGLSLKEAKSVLRQAQGKESKEIPQEVLKLVKEREELRRQKRFHLSDQLRNKIKKLGYEIRDEEDGTAKIKKIS